MSEPTKSIPVPSAGRTFGGVWWLTVHQYFTKNQLLITLGCTVLLVLIGLPATAKGEADRFYAWLQNFYFLFVAPILVFASAGRAMRDQTKSAAADYIFTRPVRRWLYVLCRYVAHVAVTVLIYLPVLAAVLGLGMYRGIPDVWSLAPRLLGTQILMITVSCGFGFFFGALTSRYIVLGLIYGFVIEKGLGSIPTQIAGLSVSRHLKTLLDPVVNSSLGGENFRATFFAALTLLAFAAVTSAGAALITQRREFSGDRAKDL